MVEDARSVELSMRRERRHKIASVANKLYADASDVYDRSIGEQPAGMKGCLVGLGRRVRRGLGCMPTRQRLADEDLLVASSKQSTSGLQTAREMGQQGKTAASMGTMKGRTFASAFFGQRKAISTPAQRLQLAQQSISERTMSLEQRAQEMRAQAQEQVKAGSKQAALRSLRRSKQLEAQAQNLAKASIAVERQADMLEEAGLQQEVAHALQAGVKDMKKVQTAMKTVETISDDAAAMADDVDEINQLLSQLADTGADLANIDDDDLMAELDDMVEESASSSKESETVAQAPAQIAALPVPKSAPQASESASSYPVVPNAQDMISVSLN